MMYIKKIYLKNVRCFVDEEIDLGEAGTSVLIAGNNGTGKSSIIRSIAMGLCDRDSAAALLRELSGNFVKWKDKDQGTNESTITIELHYKETKNDKEASEKAFLVETKITEYPEIIGETVTQKILIPHLNEEINIPEDLQRIINKCKKESPDNIQDAIASYVPWINTFATGYGPGLRTTGTAKFTEYFAPDALYSIFNYSAPLQDPETAWRRLSDAARRQHSDEKLAKQAADDTNRKISKLIHAVLGLEANYEVVLEPNGIFVKNKTSKELIELDAKGDGHKSVTKVLLDILIWYLLFENYDGDRKGDERTWLPLEIVEENEEISVPDVKGIVIIDEIEQHLHPTLQRQIIKSLSNKLPNVQFIITTHSPLCLSGTSDVISNDGTQGYKIYSVYQSDGLAKIEMKDLPAGLRADQILVDYFELPTTINVTLQKKVDRLRQLFAKGSLDDAEKVEYQKLDEELQKDAPLLAERESDRQREIERDNRTEELRKLLIEQGVLKDDSIKSST